MVERGEDKTIRVLQEILKEPITDDRLDKDGKSHPSKLLFTDNLKISRSDLKFNLAKLGLTISDEQQDPFGSDFATDYLMEVIVEKKDIERLSSLLKKYEAEYPKRKKPRIREKTLELISQKIGNLDTGTNLVKFLKDCGVDGELIIYPNTKWRMICDALVYLSNSAKREDETALSKVIGEATHPLMHGGDTASAKNLREEFNNYLHYDNMGIAYDAKDGIYAALRNADEDEIEIQNQIEADDYISHLEQQSEKQLEFLSRPENKEKISLLRKAYQLLINIVFFFCEDPVRPTVELNQNFQYLYKLVNTTVNELGLSGVSSSPFSRKEHFFYLPFSNLFSAEKVYKEQGTELSWPRIRPEMNAMFGDIEEIYQEISGSDVLAEPDKQEKLNKIQLSLSVLKKKREIARKVVAHRRTQSAPTTKIEITSLPEVRIKGLEENVVLTKPKNKKIQLRKFPSDLRWEEISIRFLNEHEVIVKARNETLQTTYEAMGFQDEKRKLPNKQWILLRLLAVRNGEMSWENNSNLSVKDINKLKKQKQSLSDALKAFFQISDSEPFHDYKTEKAYKIKLTLTPEPELKSVNEREIIDDKDKLGFQEYYEEQAREVDDS